MCVVISLLPHCSQREALEGKRSAECDAGLKSQRDRDGKCPFHTAEGDSEQAELDAQQATSQNLRSLTAEVLLSYKQDLAPAFAETPQQSVPLKLISKVAP